MKYFRSNYLYNLLHNILLLNKVGKLQIACLSIVTLIYDTRYFIDFTYLKFCNIVSFTFIILPPKLQSGTSHSSSISEGSKV